MIYLSSETNVFLDVTKEFWNYICIPIEIIKRPSPTIGGNSIILNNILLFGLQGSGKTTTANAIANGIVKYYGKDNVSCAMSSSGDIERLLKHGFRDKLVNVVLLDNMTLRKVKSEALSEYFRSRHILKERFGRVNGYILTLIGIHRYHGLQKELRSNENGMIIKDSVMSDYDRNFLRRKIGEENLRYLDMIERERLYDPRLMNLGYFISRNINGWINIPASKDFVFHEVRQTPNNLINLMFRNGVKI